MTYLLYFVVTATLALLFALCNHVELTARKAARIILLGWLAIPLLVIGALLSLLWINFGVLTLIAMWLLGMETVIG